jgi:hypothetical protein
LVGNTLLGEILIQNKKKRGACGKRKLKMKKNQGIRSIGYCEYCIRYYYTSLILSWKERIKETEYLSGNLMALNGRNKPNEERDS